MRFLDKHYGIRRDGNTLMIGRNPITAHEKGTRFKGTMGLWEILTRQNVNSDVITKRDLNVYKSILVLTNTR
jgi:hypothetical protein